jgi:peptidoglycan DL-endopeptidase LytF
MIIFHDGDHSSPGSRKKMNMGLPIRWILKLIIVMLVLGMLAGCTRERAIETTPASVTPEAASPGAAADEPQVVVVPLTSPAPVDTPEPEPTPTPAFATAPYAVQPGDSVSTIAEQFGTTSQIIREMNLLTTDALQVGQVLRVPNTTGAGTAASGDPAPAAGPFEYVVKSGDTLLSIAIEFGVSANDIVAANTLSNPNNLFVGQTIIIPNYQPQAASTPIPAVPYEYVIQAGDTLLSIAQQFGVSADVIMQANTLRDANNLIQGQVLFIPGYQGSTTGTASERTGAEAAVHTVKAGETLFAIAQIYNVTAAEIVAANRIANPNQLQAGQRLTIPGIAAAEIEAANRVIHVVAAGEGLNAIARRYNVSVNAIIEANNINNPNFLTVGQELIIPASE